MLQLRQSGTTSRRRTEFEEAMAWNPDAIYVFTNMKGELAPVLARDERVRHVELPDPTPATPWGEAELGVFRNAAKEASEQLGRDQRVLVVCVAGANRSRALARASLKLAAMRLGAAVDAVPRVPPAQDPDLERLVAVVENPEAYKALAPLGLSRPPAQKRRRGGGVVAPSGSATQRV